MTLYLRPGRLNSFLRFSGSAILFLISSITSQSYEKSSSSAEQQKIVRITKEEKMNPQGYCGTVNPSFAMGFGLSTIRIDDDYVVINKPLSFDWFDFFSGLNIPVSPYLSFTANCGVLRAQTWQYSLGFGPSIFSKSIHNFDELQNPNGLIKSFFVSPKFTFQWGGDGSKSFGAGSLLGFVATDIITLTVNFNFHRWYSEYNLPLGNYKNTQKIAINNYSCSLSPIIYIENASHTDRNPDGRIWSVTLKPSYGISFLRQGFAHQMSLVLTTPFSKSLSGVISTGFSYHKNETLFSKSISKGFAVSAGVNVYNSRR